MEQAIRRFLTYLETDQGRAANTILAYRADLNQFARVVAMQAGSGATPGDLTPTAIAAFVHWLEGQGYRPATLSRKMAAARSFLDYLGSHEITLNPALAAELHAPTAPRHPPRILAQDEVAALLAAAGKSGTARGLRDSAILSLLYSTGLRATDLVGLRLDDVDTDLGTVHRAGRPEAPLAMGMAAAPVREYVKHGRPHLARGPEERALFLNQRGQELSRQGLWLVVKRWSAACGLGIDVSPHSLRHSMAHHLLDQGRSRREVQQLLGLSSPSAIRVRRETGGG
jgi:integrase/recombinase XerD